MTAEVLPPELTPEDVQGQMAGTRAHIGEQVHALGDLVSGMVHDANAAVTDAFQGGVDAAHALEDTVRQATTDSVAYVRNALDLRGHVRRHPWLAVGGATLLGFWCGGLLRRR